MCQHSRSGNFAKEKHFLPLPGIGVLFVSRPVRCLATILTTKLYLQTPNASYGEEKQVLLQITKREIRDDLSEVYFPMAKSS
jgi:hypothetical protein